MVSAEISRGKERESARKWEELKKQRNPCREESSEDRSRDEKKDKRRHSQNLRQFRRKNLYQFLKYTGRTGPLSFIRRLVILNAEKVEGIFQKSHVYETF